MKNDPEGRAALRLIRTTVEEHCPPGVLPSDEAVNGINGPSLMDEAEAIAPRSSPRSSGCSCRPP